jgi:hypothetical protein
MDLNKFIYIAVGLCILNYAMGGFIFQQLGKIDYTGPIEGKEQYITCFAGAYILSPIVNGIPLPATDDVIFVAILGLLTLGVLSLMNKHITTRWKIAIFILWWLVYKGIGYYLVYTSPGCAANLASYEEVMSPLTPVFLALAAILLIKLYAMNRK